MPPPFKRKMLQIIGVGPKISVRASNLDFQLIQLFYVFDTSQFLSFCEDETCTHQLEAIRVQLNKQTLLRKKKIKRNCPKEYIHQKE